jgi:hypothetical protein
VYLKRYDPHLNRLGIVLMPETLKLVLDGRNAPTQVIGVVNFPKSVNPKTLSHGNTEPSVKACVETGRETSPRDEGTVRTTKKFVEPHRNDAASQQCEATFLIISTIVGESIAPTLATEVVQSANSVKAKTLSHANTELNSVKADKCVENIDGRTQEVQDMFRAYGKPYEAFRNETLALRNECSNKTDHRFCPYGSSSLPPTLATELVHFPNSVNPKSFRYGNTEPSMNFNRFKACVENVQEASMLDEDSFRTLWKHSEPSRNEMVAPKGL